MNLINGRTTIKDIAAGAGVSVATVHLVLSGKPGPKVETKACVLEIAKRLEYKPNSVASSLKRGTTKIAAVLPEMTEDNAYYYEPIWAGVRAYCESAKDFNIELVEHPYTNKELVAVPDSAIQRVMQEEKIAGLIVLGDIESPAKKTLRTLSNRGMPIVLVNSDAPEVGRICCVQAENYLLGCIMAEILSGHISNEGSILLCAGDRNTPANAASVKGVEDYPKENFPGRKTYKIHYCNDMPYLYSQLVEHLYMHKDIAGACSVTARGSVQLAKALRDTGRAGAITAIGSDVFKENIDSLRDGTFTSVMFKNPFHQGWLAAENLFNYIFRTQNLNKDMFLVKSEVVFKSSISMYE